MRIWRNNNRVENNAEKIQFGREEKQNDSKLESSFKFQKNNII